MEACRSLCARGRGLEARHFGFGVLRDVARTRWRGLTAEERMEMAGLAHGMLLEVSAGGAAEAYAVQSKAATRVAGAGGVEGARGGPVGAGVPPGSGASRWCWGGARRGGCARGGAKPVGGAHRPTTTIHLSILTSTR